MKLRSAACMAVLAFSGCASVQGNVRACSMESARQSLSRLKELNSKLNEGDSAERLSSAAEFSKAVGDFACSETIMRKELRMLELAKYAILDASIGRLEDPDVAVRLASLGTIRILLMESGLRLDRLSFSALTAGLRDGSKEVREKTAEILSFVCSSQPSLCAPHERSKGTVASL
ncbi:MAG: hypothetical protein U0R44_04170 [Candidatus Micrarchaeia archaeon]